MSISYTPAWIGGLTASNHINAFDQTGNVIYNTPTPFNEPITIDYYTPLCNAFNLELTEDQLFKLNELANSGDEANKIIAANLFKYMLDGKK